MSDGPEEHEIAAAYDDLNQRFPIPFVDDMSGKPLDRRLVEDFSARSGSARMCDLGCGTGKVARLLSELGHEVVGIDISAKAIAQARALHPSITFEQMSFADTTFADNWFGGLTSFFSIIHLPRTKLPSAFAELARILQVGGHLLISCYEGDGVAKFSRADGAPVDMVTTLLSEAELSRLLAGAGFDVLEAYRRGPYKYEFDCSRLFVLARLVGSEGKPDGVRGDS